MIIKTKKQMVEQSVPVYIAYDGTEFLTETDCANYERLCAAKKAGEIDAMFKRIVIKEFFPENFGIYEAATYICRLNDENEYKIIEAWCDAFDYSREYLTEPMDYPCRYLFPVDDGNYASTESKNFMEWARDVIKVLDETKI